MGYFSYYYPPNFERVRIINTLQSTPGKHVIIVRRSYFSWPGFEWVYNEADIDASRIVWARDMGDELNQELADYYKDRKIWLLHADNRTLVAYHPSVPIGSELVQLAPVTHSEKAKTPIGEKNP